MGRKKPDAIVALEAMTDRVPSCAHCEVDAIARTPDGQPTCMTHYTAYFTEQALQSLTNHDLKRKPKESLDAWRTRMKKWLRQNARIKSMLPT